MERELWQSEKDWSRNERKEGGRKGDVKGKEQKSPLDTPLSSPRPEADLFYFVFPEIPRIRTVKFRGIVDESRRNA